MKISLNWLSDYVDIKKINKEKLLRDLTFKAVEVDNFNDFSYWDGVVVGEIKAVDKHVNADKLSVARVDVGGGKILNIVCGGTNLVAGKKVPVATVGTNLVDHKTGEIITIEKVNLRGEWSEGMICAPEEIGFMKEENVGRPIMILGDNLKVGAPLKKAMLLDEGVVEIDVLANRGDLMSHEGVARELSALFDLKFSSDSYNLPKAAKDSGRQLTVKIVDDKLCPRYSALVISNIKVEPSPDWLANRLRAVGLRPINNIVDLTNYLMLDLGQPLHAFDFDQVAAGKMVVRPAEEGERVVTLDGIERTLKSGMQIIADKDKLIDLAGVMGGLNSEITAETTTIVLQAAVFEPMNIRATARVLGHRTEAVSRYEKAVDAQKTLAVLGKALGLLKEMNAEVRLEQIIDLKNKKTVDQEVAINFNLNDLEKKLGIKIPEKSAIKILSGLRCELEKTKNDNIYSVKIPSWRHDLNIPEDLVEEVGRIYGYDNLREDLPMVQLANWQLDRQIILWQEVLNFLRGLGFNEVNNYSFVSPKMARKIGLNPDDHIRVVNPMSEDQAIMRQELISSLLVNVNSNSRYLDSFRIMEIGKTYFLNGKNDYREPWRLTGCLLGASESFYTAKGVVESLLNNLNINYTTRDFVAKDNDYITATTMPLKSLEFMAGDDAIATIGEVKLEVLGSFDIKTNNPVFWFDVDFNQLKKLFSSARMMKESPKFPAVELDLAVVIDNNILWANIEKLARKVGGELVQEVRLFDVYEGAQIVRGKKSVAFRIIYRAADRTLTFDEVRTIQDKIIGELKQTFGAEVRG